MERDKKSRVTQTKKFENFSGTFKQAKSSFTRSRSLYLIQAFVYGERLKKINQELIIATSNNKINERARQYNSAHLLRNKDVDRISDLCMIYGEKLR